MKNDAQSLSVELEENDDCDIDFLKVMADAGLFPRSDSGEVQIELGSSEELALAKKVSTRSGRSDLAIKVLARQAKQDSPERKLFFAVLSQSITDLNSGTKAVSADADNFWKTPRHESICALCGINPEFARGVLMKLRVLKKPALISDIRP